MLFSNGRTEQMLLLKGLGMQTKQTPSCAPDMFVCRLEFSQNFQELNHDFHLCRN